MNLWSVILAFAAAKRWYSSKTEDKHHFCSFLKHPTKQPVRCCRCENIQQLVQDLDHEVVSLGKVEANCKSKSWSYLASLAVNKQGLVSWVCKGSNMKGVRFIILWCTIYSVYRKMLDAVPRTTFRASRILSSGMVTKGSCSKSISGVIRPFMSCFRTWDETKNSYTHTVSSNKNHIVWKKCGLQSKAIENATCS